MEKDPEDEPDKLEYTKLGIVKRATVWLVVSFVLTSFSGRFLIGLVCSIFIDIFKTVVDERFRGVRTHGIYLVSDLVGIMMGCVLAGCLYFFGVFSLFEIIYK